LTVYITKIVTYWTDKRNIKIRLKEHIRNISLYQINKSVFASHVEDKGHTIQNETKFLILIPV
jgi:hypothetical protein